MEPVPNELTRLVAGNTNYARIEPASCDKNYRMQASQANSLLKLFDNVVSTIKRSKKHQELFEEMVEAKNLDGAKFHWIKGAQIDLDRVTLGAQTELEAFLVANATKGRFFELFKEQVGSGQYILAEIMAKTTDMPLRDRIKIFKHALKANETTAQIAKKILGSRADSKLKIIIAIYNGTLHQLIPQIARTWTQCPYTMIDSSITELAWSKGKFIINEPPWEEKTFHCHTWITSVLYNAIWEGNITLVKQQLDHMEPSTIPTLPYLFDANKNEAVSLSTRELMTTILQHHKNTRSKRFIEQAR